MPNVRFTPGVGHFPQPPIPRSIASGIYDDGFGGSQLMPPRYTVPKRMMKQRPAPTYFPRRPMESGPALHSLPMMESGPALHSLPMESGPARPALRSLPMREKPPLSNVIPVLNRSVLSNQAEEMERRWMLGAPEKEGTRQLSLIPRPPGLGGLMP